MNRIVYLASSKKQRSAFDLREAVHDDEFVLLRPEALDLATALRTLAVTDVLRLIDGAETLLVQLNEKLACRQSEEGREELQRRIVDLRACLYRARLQVHQEVGKFGRHCPSAHS